jgi:hypothetical protein
MQSIKLHGHVGSDGLLKLEVPVGLPNTDLEIILIMQPMPVVVKTSEELGWSTFIEQTSGCPADDPIERGSQGEYEIREEVSLI